MRTFVGYLIRLPILPFAVAAFVCAAPVYAWEYWREWVKDDIRV